jgi:hypothetical protein
MKKILIAIVTALMLATGVLASGTAPVNPMSVAVGPTYFTVQNFVAEAGYDVNLQSSTGVAVNFSYPLSTHFSAYPSVNVAWNKISNPLANKADATFTTVDFDIKYTFNPGQTTEFYLVGGPTWFNSHYSNDLAGYSGNNLTFNVGGGVQFPFFYPKLKLLTEAKYYYVPQTAFPLALQGTTGYNAWNVSALLSWKF